MSFLPLAIDWTFFDRVFMGEQVSNYLWFAGIILATLLLKKPVAALLTRISSGLAARYSYMSHKNTIRDMLFKPMERLLQTVLFYIAINQLENTLERLVFKHIAGKKKIVIRLGDVVDHVFLFLFIIFLTVLISRFIDFIYYMRMGKAQQEKNYSRVQLLPLMKELAKLIVWILSTFWILGSVFYVNIPTLITGLGVGGVAIALAGKETVENFFAAFTILSDKPFQTGDAIKLGEFEGVVERIGFRSTRLRNVDGAAYIIPNQNLVGQNLINLSMRETRGMKIIANIRYGIAPEALQQLTTKLKSALAGTELVKQPVETIVETFDKETFQLVISYHLPHPLPDNRNLNDVKKDINMMVFGIISNNATLGAPATVS